MEDAIATEEKERGLLFAVIFFISMLVVTLDKLQLTERAIGRTSSWWLMLEIAGPWLFGALFVVQIFRDWGRWKAYPVTRSVVFLLGAVLYSSYDALNSLVARWH